MMKSLAAKNIVITGAGSGIGRLMAHRLAGEGAHLALIDIRKTAAETVREELSEVGVTIHIYKCNIADDDDVAATVAMIQQDFDRVDILINNAGIVTGKSVSELTLSEIRNTMNVNFFGHVIFIKHFLPQMIERNEGHIVNISSSSGLIGFPRAADYSASKFAEVGFTEALRMELKKDGYNGVKTTLVCPYVIDTGMFAGFRPLLFNPILKPDKVAKKIIAAVKKEQAILKIPASLNLILALKLFPPAVMDWVFDKLGLSRAMDHYRGRSG